LEDQLKYKQLGNTNLKPSELGFGCSHIASLTTRYSSQEVLKTLKLAFDRGINFFDTADIYGQGDSERALGKALGQQREQVIYCSKAGLTLSAPQHLVGYVKPLIRPLLTKLPSASKKTTAIRQQIERQCFQINYIQLQIESSLRRLQTDYLDLFLLHNPPKEIIQQSEIFTLLQSLQAKGLIRYYGVSCRNHDEVQLCLQNEGITCVQINLNPINIKTSMKLLNQVQKSGVGIIARECLTNKNTSLNLWHHPPDVGSVKKFNASQLALQAVLENDAINVAIIGMSCRKHLSENLAVLN
jgi:aryl-alcohol dehydrogenase-like predicted oxidoreductase